MRRASSNHDNDDPYRDRPETESATDTEAEAGAEAETESEPQPQRQTQPVLTNLCQGEHIVGEPSFLDATAEYSRNDEKNERSENGNRDDRPAARGPCPPVRHEDPQLCMRKSVCSV